MGPRRRVDLQSFATGMEIDLEIVDWYEQQFGAAAALSGAQRFMLAYLSEMRKPLPQIASQGLEVAKRFRNGQAARSDLLEARVNCWKFLDARRASTDCSTPEHCAIRAVICLLDDLPGNGGDTVDLIDFFLGVTNRFEDHSGIASSLLERCFSDLT